ncbi:MAG: hypothetical protein M3Z02_07190, partial [Actinomycetota bacterium]|nr:hypothetical protein [Actinomycetota bacterium]
AAGGTEVRIRNNRDIDPGELAEPDFPEHPVLLDVTMAEGAGPIGDLASKITGLTRLRQRVY